MTKTTSANKKTSFTAKILVGMLTGLIVGCILRALPENDFITNNINGGLFEIGGQIFIAILKMLVVPIVFVSLVCGAAQMQSSNKMGKVFTKTFILYILTTAVAITIAICLSILFNVGAGEHLTPTTTFDPKALPSLKDTIINIVPSNPIEAMSKGNMLQVIVFALLFGYAISISGKAGRTFITFFNAANTVLMQLIHTVLRIAPYGVFCLIAKLFFEQGIGIVGSLAGYFFTVLLALAVQWLAVYGGLIKFVGGLSPIMFFKKMAGAMLFAFSTSSSSATLPITLDTVENKIGVRNSVASFVIPLGATINMDGTAIMQGVATVFIANMYGIDIGIIGYLTVILTATLASIGTAGVPGVGLITLTLVLNQVGLPVEGIALIIGIDRLLDMARTAINVCGDCMVATIVGKSQNAFDEKIFNSKSRSGQVTSKQVKNWHE